MNQRILTFVVFFLSLTSAIGQTTHTITLYVNTADLTTSNDAYQYAYFEGQGEGTDPRIHVVDVNPGDIVLWRGISTSGNGDEVRISAINYEGGRNVFNKNILKDTRQSVGQVSALVQQGTQGYELKYKLSFKVFRNGKLQKGKRLNNGQRSSGTYHIDPKIRVRRSR